MRIVKSDEDLANDQIDGFNIEIIPKNVGDIVEQAIEYRKKNVWNTSDGSVDVEDLPYKDKLGKIADDLHGHDLKTAILVDVDVDGFCSAAIIYKALKAINNKLDIDTLLPNAKLHGIKANIDLVKKDYDYLFLPDSSANDLHTIAELEKNGTKCIVIDHHILEQESYLLDNPDKFLICSNQYQDSELDRNLTGAGMALLVTKLWKQKYDIELNYDLAALGQIADMSNLDDKDIWEIVQKGLANMNSKMLTTFFEDDLELLTVKHLQFSLIPRINAVSRIGEHEDRELIFDALIDQDELKPVSVRHKGQDGKFHTETVKMDVYERAKRTLDKVKGRQDRLVKKALRDVEFLTNRNDDFNVAVLDKKYDKGISGLVANKMLGNTKQPTLVVKRNGERLDGSGRFPVTINGLQLLQGVNAFAAGHEQAFGVGFKANQFDDVSEAIGIAVNDAPDYVYRVDEALVNELPSVAEIRAIYQSSKTFRGAKDEPLIAVLGLKVEKQNITLKNNWLKITLGDIIVNDFNADEEIKRYVESGFGDKCFSFICSAGFNFWTGRPIPTLTVEKLVKSDGVEVGVNKDNFIF
ncbi:hypothetical protein [Lactobacillus phage Satyr]|uniref:DDH domain-containing protein n=1 Tax=Lactobacillus phage Satyr TaxID=2070201 RepID=A0A2K9V547_9CAUD|nr:RecJ-like ssDNA exonuclease [Lactobacillus phage Satyr]AUV57287.1 hypothetical protein [Lactobacillus phage Satyr]